MQIKYNYPDIPSGYILTEQIKLVAEGIEYDFFTDFNLSITGITGSGVAPVEIKETKIAETDWTVFRTSVTGDRIITLTGTLSATSFPKLKSSLARLAELVTRRDSTKTIAPCHLRYEDRELEVRYVSGLEGVSNNEFTSQIQLRFVAYKPYWTSTSETKITDVAVRTTHSSVRTVQKDYYGRFSDTSSHGGKLYVLTSGLYRIDEDNVSIYKSPDGTIDNWTLLGTASGGEVFSLFQDSHSSLYACGSFTAIDGTSVTYISKYNGLSWESVCTSIDGYVRGGISYVEYIYIYGDFANADGYSTSILRIDITDGSSTKVPTGPTPVTVNGSILDAVMGDDGVLYFCGEFDSPNKYAFSYNPVYDSWYDVQLPEGFNATVRTVCSDEKGVYFGGLFTEVCGIDAQLIVLWNGMNFIPLGNGVNGTSVDTVVSDDTGNIYIAGSYIGAGAITSSSPLRWNGTEWSAMDIDTTMTVDLFYGSSTLFISSTSSGTIYSPGETVVDNYASAATFPSFKFTGPGELRSIKNTTTGDEILFRITLFPGETLLVDLENHIYTSSARGNLFRFVLDGSSASFRLIKGENIITVYADTNVDCVMTFRENYWTM